MSNSSFQIAFDRATSEITEIDALMEKLIRRRELLARAVEPLQRLVEEGGLSLFPETDARDARSEGGTDMVEDPGFPAQPEEAANCVLENGSVSGDAREDVAALAYRFWSERGGMHGHHEEDWFRAVEEAQHSGL